jgi:cytosolic iron-sulfur protein assembly protein CIAO1
VKIWARAPNGGSWYQQATLEETHNRTVRACSWSPDGKNLATSSFDATTAIWEVQAGVWEHVRPSSPARAPAAGLIACCRR